MIHWFLGIFLFLILPNFSFSQTAPEITGRSLTLPRLTTQERDSNATSEGQIIYNSTTKQLEFYNGSYWQYVLSYQNPFIFSLKNISVKQSLNSSIEFSIAIDPKLTANYEVSGNNVSISNPTGTLSSNKLVINFIGLAVGTGNLNLIVTDSQGKSLSQEVNIAILPAQQELTKTYVNETLTSAYKSLLGWTDSSPSWTPLSISPSNWILDLASDEFHKGSDPGDQVDWSAIEIFQWTGALNPLAEIWNARYEGVKRANEAIRTVNAYLQSNPNETSYSNQILAEARFLRAFFYFDLYKIFKNIPYYKEYDTFYQLKSSISTTVIKSIIEDFDFAIANLQDQKYAPDRIDKIVALAFCAKARLYAKDYQSALAMFNVVINSRRYSLNQDFHDNFKEDSNYTSEAILQATVKFGEPKDSGFLRGDRLALPYGSAPSQCCGFMSPSYDLAYSFRTDANGLPIPSTTTPSRIQSGSSIQLDPRIDWTIGRTGVPYLDWGVQKDDWIRNPSYSGYYTPKKNALASLGGIRNSQNLANVNYNLLRYADVLLMAAECEVQIGSLDKARSYVNSIRERAGHTAQGASSISVPINSSEITWSKYKIGQYTQPWTDKNVAFEAVKLERHLELAMEGHRLFDLQRWGDLEKIMIPYIQREKQVVSVMTNAIYPNSRNYAFPIPITEIEKSNGFIIQNPGY